MKPKTKQQYNERLQSFKKSKQSKKQKISLKNKNKSRGIS